MEIISVITVLHTVPILNKTTKMLALIDISSNLGSCVM